MADTVDPRILQLAAEYTECSNEKTPELLLQLKDIVKSVPAGSEEQRKVKEDLYHYGLIQCSVLFLIQDYRRVNGGWMTAASLADILSLCCVGLDPQEDAEEFYNKLLPSALGNMLLLARRIQARYVRAMKEEERGELFSSFRRVSDSVSWLFSGHVQLAKDVLRMKHFLQLLMADDEETEAVAMSVLQKVLRVDSSAPRQLDEDSLLTILDELVYKLSASSNPVIGRAATGSLLLMLESSPGIGQLVGARYKGLRTLLSKQWTGKGFGQELGQLLEILYSSSYQQEDLQRLHRAACTIQAVWRAFLVRKRMKRLPKAVTSLQRSFRARREREVSQLQRQREEEALRQQLQLHRLRAMRRFREKQLALLEIVHPGQMDKHLREVQEKAAQTIQRIWGGYRERRKFHKQKVHLAQYKAAVCIQRAALRFLNRRRKMRESLTPWRKTDLSDERRQELQLRLDSRLHLHPAPQMSAEQSSDLHSRAQEKLGQYLLKRSFHRGSEQRREALLAQINTDINMLMDAPALAHVTEKDLDKFTSRSVPVALKAKQRHNVTLRRSRWPWWRKLGDEFIEDDEVLLSDLPVPELGALFLAGTKD
ncbi:hypothetical protein XENTR_v10024880 [Xenopus tropicalis]|uniref:IQ calmodulin-binding motif-containing protein 1 isoform X1 n=1 Tax=Xenopus tropicalis TaxID=8364 RepID=F7CAK5_XENTR|nr:IQ calmodulin-binding motif-containing protein 1 isoform X1 [Xenopus tropicalis]KAE8581654.1 hypothetical protein XENTR_v10024880 [Xenopus tropicalis]KAE8581655.1 hypothetical protein XENTR_v10024880 [Xenopus tropicalis]